MRNRSLIGQIILAVFALVATTWIAGNLLNLGREDTTPITERMVGIQPAYGTGGQNPTPTPCPYGCSSCCNSTYCTPAENDDNWSWVTFDNDAFHIGSAGSRDHCSNPHDWNNHGVHFQLIEDATLNAKLSAEDYDAFCGGSVTHDSTEVVKGINARVPDLQGITGVIVSCNCPCNGAYVDEHIQPTASGNVLFCFTKITLKKNGNRNYEIQWEVTPKLSSSVADELCEAPEWGNNARITVEGAQTNGNIGDTEFTGLQAGWKGSVPWDGSFPGGGQWDETYLHVDLSQNYITDIEASPEIDYCYQASPPSDLGGDLLIPACGGGSGCSLGSRGGGPQGQGFSMCSPPFQTPINVPFPEPRLLYGWNPGSGLNPFGEDTPLAQHSLFMFVAPDSQAGSYYHLYQGAQSIRTVKKWSDTHFINDKGIIEATSEISGSDTILRWDIGDYRYQFRGPTSEEWSIQSIILRNTGNARVTWGYTNGNLTTIDFADTANDISLHWTGNPQVLDYISYPNNVTEDFRYNGTTLNGIEQTIGATPTPISRVQFTEDGYNRPSSIKGYSVSGSWPGTLQTQNDYTYKSQYDDRLSTYERFGNTYTVTDTDTTHTVTNPDTSYVQETTSGDSTTTTVTTAVVGKDDESLSTTIVERNRAHDVVTEITDGEDHTTTYLYRFQVDPNADPYELDLLDRITFPSPLSNYTLYTYDTENRVERVSQKTSGNTELAYVQYEYDDEDRITRTYTGTLNETLREYIDDLLHSITDGEGRKTYFDYNGDEQLVAVGDGSATTTFEYDSEGRRELTTSPLGIETKYEYHTSTGNLQKVYNAYGTASQVTTEYTYDLSGYGDNLIKVTDGMKRFIEYEYDNWGRLYREKIIDGAVSRYKTYTYSSISGEYLDRIEDYNYNEERFSFYAPGFLKQRSWHINGDDNPWGTLNYVYYGDGKIHTISSVGGDCSCSETKTYEYTENGSLESKTAIQEGEIEYGYDGIGRLTSFTIPNVTGTATLNTVSYLDGAYEGYDAANRLTRITAATTGGAATHPRVQISYNAANQITQMGFAAANPTATPVYKVSNTYNSTNGRLEAISYDGVSSTADRKISYGYNNDGLRTYKEHKLRTTGTDFLGGQKVNYTYDNLNRLTREYCEGIGPSTCISLNGSGTVTVASGGDMAGSFGAFTVDMRVKLDSTFNTPCTLFTRGDSGGTNYVKLSLDANGNLTFTVRTSTGNNTRTLGPLPKDRWLHVAGTFTGSAMTLVVGGTTSSVALSGTIGTWAGTPLIGQSFKGKIDEVHVRNVGAPTYSTYSNYTSGGSTVGLWHFNTGSGTTEADDDSGNQQNASWGAGVSWGNNNTEVGVGKYDRDFTDGYDKVGNRTKMRLINQTGTVSTDVTWNMTYNALNQLTQRYNGTDWNTNGTERYGYFYDSNGNQTRVTKETYGGGVWTQVERWNYTYNIDNRLTQVEKRTGTGTGTYAGKEMYQYCLSCDGAMSTWRTFGLGSQTYPTAWRQYEYDGLNLLRVDERCDNDKDGIIETGETTWRTVEVNTHKPGALGALVGKRVYVYSDAADSSPNGSNDYTYTYDALGNVQVVYKASGTVGQEAYFFTQDAFGNELSGDANIPASNRTNLLGGATWATARTAGITEHQTGKIQSAFSGLQHFGARWYDPLVGRFVGRENPEPMLSGKSDSSSSYCSTCKQYDINSAIPILKRPSEVYEYCRNIPTMLADCNGLFPIQPAHFFFDSSCWIWDYHDWANTYWQYQAGHPHDEKGYKRHCLVCCQLGRCWGALGAGYGYYGNIIWEFMSSFHGWHFNWPTDSLDDILYCLNGGSFGTTTDAYTLDDCINHCAKCPQKESTHWYDPLFLK